jgi:hypothetical protein
MEPTTTSTNRQVAMIVWGSILALDVVGFAFGEERVLVTLRTIAQWLSLRPLEALPAWLAPSATVVAFFALVAIGALLAESGDTRKLRSLEPGPLGANFWMPIAHTSG